MLKKLANWIKNIFIYPPELKEMHKRALETNRIYEQAMNKAVWNKDFDVKDVKKALDKQAPKPAVKKPRSKTMSLKKGTSDKTRSANIAKEIKAGKKPSQAAAIGYAVQREAIAKKGGKAASKAKK